MPGTLPVPNLKQTPAKTRLPAYWSKRKANLQPVVRPLRRLVAPATP